jgi:hypothetical protein
MMSDPTRHIQLDEEAEDGPVATRTATRKSLLVFGTAAALMILAAAMIHVRAWYAYEAGGATTASVVARLESAGTAFQLEPFIPAYRARALELGDAVANDPAMSLDDRVAAARTALKADPGSRERRIRYGYLYAQRLARDGHLPQAVDVMAVTYKEAVGDLEMLAFFKRIQAELALDTNRKAHLQHGHEGPGGVLAPSDVER